MSKNEEALYEAVTEALHRKPDGTEWAVAVSDILERRTSGADRAKGLDLADYLLRENGFETCQSMA